MVWTFLCVIRWCFLFFFKQKTAYEMRISDWSSDVCSSDLFNVNLFKTALVLLVTFHIYSDPAKEAAFNALAGGLFILPFFLFSALAGQLAEDRKSVV